ncbi:MAG: hypothetical protein MOGMAGMI_00938 [Candidatus Omnitrophica bacterium]|nr:hypothetical protein [Candidatus Omnitrophota bacterium]
MTSGTIQKPERREFLRLSFKTPVRFKTYAPESGPSNRVAQATSKNISQSGILFQTQADVPPQVSSILWMDLDIRTLRICQEIEDRALVLGNGLLGKVVRIEEDPSSSGTYDVGVCFLTQDQKADRDVQELLTLIEKGK